MRWIIFALAFGFVGSQQVRYEPVFGQKKTYLYQYEGVVLTGLPDDGLAKGGLKITSKVQISSMGQKNHLLKVISPQIEEYSGIWPEENFIPARKLTRKLSPQLSQPVMFEYSRGRVGKIFAHPDIPENIVNIHRGILNILQISIKKNQNIYELQENGLEGICQVSYTIQEDRKARHVTVTKSKDLNNCHEKVSESKGSANFQPCETCHQKGKNFRSVSTYTYILKNTEEGAEISEVVSQETHHFTPFNERDGAAVSESRQHLYLLDFKDQSPPMPKSPMENHGSLRYQFSNELLQMPMQLVRTSHNDTKITKLVEKLVQINQEKAHPDAPQMFLQLIQLLRSTNLTNLQSIWESESKKQSQRQWILNTIPATGTYEAVQFIQSKIEQGELSQFEAAQVLFLVLHAIKPDCHGVDNATVLLSSPYMQKNPFLRKLTLLAYGSLVQKYCNTVRLCPDEALQPLHELVTEAGSRGHEEETILGLKAIGNAGQPASLKRIQKLLPGFSSSANAVSNRIQAVAVMALRNIGKKDPRKVRSIAMQLFMNRRNRAEMRMKAFIVLMETKPSLALVTTATDVMTRETNLHLISFVYSYMKSLATTSVPELQSLAAICNIAVKRMSQKCDKLSYGYSKGFHFGQFTDKFLAGIDGNLYLIKKSEGILPHTAIANFKLYGLGVSTEFLEIGIQAEGLLQALLKSDKSNGRAPKSNATASILEEVHGWKPMPTLRPLANVYIKLSGQELLYVELNQNNIQEALKIMSNQARMNGLIRKLIHQLVRGISAKWTKPLVASEVRHMVPTSLGLPLELAFYSTIVSAVRAKAKMKVAHVPSNLTLPELLNMNIQLETQLTPSSVKDVVGIMGINSALIQTGVEVQLKTSTVLPVNFTARLSGKERNVKIESPPWQQETQLFSASTQAFAFSRNIEDLASAKVTPLLPSDEDGMRIRLLRLGRNSTTDHRETMDRVLPLAVPIGSVCSTEEPLDGPHSTVQKSCMKANTFGFEVCSETSVVNSGFTTNSPLYKLVGENSIQVAIKPVITPISVKKLQVELQMETRDQPFLKASHPMKRNSRNTSDFSEAMQAEGKLVLLRLKNILHHQSQNKGHLSYSSSFESTSDARMSSSSFFSSSSSSSSSVQSSYLEGIVPSIFSLFTRAILIDNKEEGYLTRAYVDTSMDQRLLQVFVDELPDGGSWKACINAEMPSVHRAMGVLKWGKDCQDYNIAAKASTGHFEHHAAVQFKAKWDKIPQTIKEAAERLADNLANVAFTLGFSQRHKKGPPHQLSVIIAATSQRTLDIVIRTSKHIFNRQALVIPVSLPFDVTSPSVRQRGLQVLTDLPAMVSPTSTAECTVTQNTFTPFNNKNFNYQMPENCAHILVQDCTIDLNFLVLIKRSGKTIIVQLLFHFSEIIIESTTAGGLELTVNGTKVPIASLPFSSSKFVSIEPSALGLKIKASVLGLESLFFDGKMIKVAMMPWMDGTTCGLCGLGHSQVSHEYQQPNRRKTTDVLKFAHSWLLPGERCNDTCKLTKTTVKLDRPIKLHGQDSTCYSVEPVLRCRVGCSPVKTVPVTYGFHCLPADSSMMPTDKELKYTNFGPKSEDIASTIDAHVACSCPSECK
ncbi:vitellogenin-like [Narcine bancroftii]|uniref:vitellogenin-like n=1 Tax=Narcine bancroftii TaxID=1343680 RepID=UPI00383220B7